MPESFQRIIVNMLQDIPGVRNFVDNILITGCTEAEHLKALEEVLKCLSKAGLRVKLSKFKFMKSEIVYLGHKIDKDGIHPLPDKIHAVKDAPTPIIVSCIFGSPQLLWEISSMVGNHPLSTLPIAPEDVSWTWGEAEEEVALIQRNC